MVSHSIGMKDSGSVGRGVVQTKPGGMETSGPMSWSSWSSVVCFFAMWLWILLIWYGCPCFRITEALPRSCLALMQRSRMPNVASVSYFRIAQLFNRFLYIGFL